MKAQRLFNYFFLLSAVLALGAADDGLPPRRYDLEQGIVHYAISGSAQQGEAVVYFDRWGMREAKYTRSVVSLVGQQDLLMVLDGPWLYQVDLGKRIGQKTFNDRLKRFLARQLGDVTRNWTHLLVSENEARQLGEEQVLGKTCQVWELSRTGQRIWYWNWIPLKIESTLPANSTRIVATQIDEEVVVSEKMFSVPPDIQFINEDINNILLSRK